MAPKRKRGIATNPSKNISRKRTRVSQRDSSPVHPHGSFDPDREYKVRSIIEETKTHYLIDWEDDEETGERFDHTWEPKANVNAQAISDWEQQQSAKGKNRQSTTARRSNAAAEEPPTPRNRPRGRPKKVVLSSPGPEPSSQVRNDLPAATAPVTQQQTEIDKSQDTGAGAQQDEEDPEESLFLPEASSPVNLPSRDLVTVQPSDPPSSFANYVTFNSSQVLTGTAPEKKPSPEPSQYQPDPVDTSKTTEETTETSAVVTTQDQESQSVEASTQDRSVRVVPDSQSLPDSQSFALSSLQKESASSSSHPAESQLLEELQSAEERAQVLVDPESQAVSTQDPQNPGSTENVEAGSQSLDVLELQPEISADNNDPSGDSQAPLGREEAATGQASTGSDQEPSVEAGPSGIQEVQVEHSSQQQAVGPIQHESNTSAVNDEPEPAELAQTPGPNQTAASTQNQLESQPGAITVTSGITPSAEDFEFSSQIDYQSPHQQRQQSPPAPEQEEEIVQKSTDSSNEVSFPFETQLPPAQSSSADANAGQQPPSPQAAQSQPTAQVDRAVHNLADLTQKAQSVPAEDTIPFQVSSPLPSVPSHSVPLLGESAPPLPAIPSTPTGLPHSLGSPARSDTMASRTIGSGESLQAKLDNMRAKRAVERAARRGQTPSVASAQSTPVKPTAIPARVEKEIAAESPSRLGSPESCRDGARSPSAVPAMQPVHAATQEEMNTSERYGTLLPQEQDRSTLRRQSTITGTTPKADATSRSHVHAVPIAVMGLQRDTYQSEINKHRSLIEGFLASSQPDEELLSETEGLLERLRHILVHPDLVNPETMTQYDVDPVTHAEWAVACSAKFRFLKQLLGSLKDREISVAVIAETGHLLQILETFLTGLDLSWERADSGKRHESIEGCPLAVKIVPPHEDVSTESLSVNVLIELEHDAAAADSSAMKLLSGKTGENPPLLMALVVPNTIEHVDRCLSKTLPRTHKLRSLVHAIFDLRFEAGKLEDGQLPVTEAAKVIAEYEDAEAGTKWPITALSVLENLDSQTESEIEPPASSETARIGEKRAHEASDDTHMPDANTFKRVRIEQPNGAEHVDLPTTINPLDIEINRVSDSINKPSQSIFNDFSSSSHPSHLSQTEKDLQSLLHTAQNRLAEHEQALADLQYRHEEQRAQLILITTERNTALTTGKTAIDRLSEKTTAHMNLRTKYNDLQTELDTAVVALTNHTIPERAEFEQLRHLLARSEADKAKLETRLEHAQRDGDYAKELYQTSSTSAQHLASQTTTLENEVALLTTRASGERTHARQMTLDAHAKLLERENKLLHARVQQAERTLASQAEELKALKEAGRGRMGTRGNSVPRSPRMGSPRKAAAGGGSRQGSPAAGDLRGRVLHPLRQG